MLKSKPAELPWSAISPLLICSVSLFLIQENVEKVKDGHVE